MTTAAIAVAFPCLTAPNGSDVLPTANGTFYTTDMSGNSGQNCQVYVEFFSDAAGTTPVSPTAGSIKFEGRPLGNNWLESSSGSVVPATSVSTPVSTYTPGVFAGKMIQGRVTFTGITGAAYARVTFWRW